MKARVLRLLAAAAVIATTSAQAQELLLGYLPSLAGPFATLSRTNEIAAQIAVDEINAAGGSGSTARTSRPGHRAAACGTISSWCPRAGASS